MDYPDSMDEESFWEVGVLPKHRIEFSQFIYREIMNIVLQGNSQINATVDGLPMQFCLPPPRQILEFLTFRYTGEKTLEGHLRVRGEISLPPIDEKPYGEDEVGTYMVCGFDYQIPDDIVR